MKSAKILWVLLMSILFIFIGIYLSIKITQNRLNDELKTVKIEPINSPVPTIFASPASQSSPSLKLKLIVKKVIDGDTIILSDNRKIRYIGIDTPEIANGKNPAQCFAIEAADFNKQLVENQEIDLEKDISETDKYGRLLRYVYSDGIMINELLLSQGFARLEEIPPDTKYYSRFKKSETEAKEAKRGLWGKCY